MTIGKSSLHDYVQKKDGRYIEKKKEAVITSLKKKRFSNLTDLQLRSC